MASECVCVCVYTCVIELAAKTKQVKQRKAENICECGRICEGITAGIISIMMEGREQTHKHNTCTEPQGPRFYYPQSDRGPYAKHIHPLINYILCTQGEKQTARFFVGFNHRTIYTIQSTLIYVMPTKIQQNLSKQRSYEAMKSLISTSSRSLNTHIRYSHLMLINNN